MPTPVTITHQAVYGLPAQSRPRGMIAPPLMTSDTSPTPYVASASAVYGVSYAYLAFRTPRYEGSAGWLTGSALPQWLAIKLAYQFVVSTYSLYPWWVDNFPSRSPTNWLFQGSPNGGTTWLTLDSRTGQSWASASTTLTYMVSNPVACNAFRIYITVNGGAGYTGLGSFQLSGQRF